MWSDGSGACHRPPASGGYTLSASYPHLPALALQVPEGHPRKPCLFQNPLVEVVELVELIRRSGLGVEEHIAAGFRYPFQKMLHPAVEGQQALSLEDVPTADMKIGPRQGDEFTLPQAAGESCVDEWKHAKLFRRLMVIPAAPDVPGMKITKTAEPYEYQAGDTVQYRVRAENVNQESGTAYFMIQDLSLPEYVKIEEDSFQVSGMEKENYKVIIYTSDKDYLQLIDENITINLIKKGLKDIKEMTPTSFKEEWGFDPIHIIDYKALRGDDSDNLKGIPGIGDKTAKDLIIKYNDFENIVKNADLNKKLGQNIVTYQDNGRLCLSLATIRLDDDLPLTKEDLLYKGYDYNQVNSFINKYNLKSLLSKLPTNFRRINSSSDSLKSKLEYKEVSSLKEIVSILNISLNKIDSLGISILLSESNYHYADIKRIYLTLLNNNFVLSFDNFLKDKDLVSLLEDEKIKKYCFDFKKLYVSLHKYNIVVKGLAFDLMLSSYLVNVTLATSSLENILSYFNIDISFALKDNDEKESLSLFDDNYSKEDPLKVCESYYSLNLYNEITTRLKESDELNLLFDIEQPLSLVLGRMEIEGFPLNKKYLETFKSEYKSKLSSLEENIYQLVGKKFNINSPKQLASILYDELKLISPNVVIAVNSGACCPILTFPFIINS